MIPTSKRMVSLPPSLVILPKTVSLYVWLLFQGWHGRARRSRSANRLLRWSGTIARVAVTIRTTVLNLISIIDIIRSMSSSLSIQWIRNLMTYTVTVRCFHPSTYARAKGEWSPLHPHRIRQMVQGQMGGPATHLRVRLRLVLRALEQASVQVVHLSSQMLDHTRVMLMILTTTTRAVISISSVSTCLLSRPLYAMRLFIPSALSLPNHTPFQVAHLRLIWGRLSLRLVL